MSTIPEFPKEIQVRNPDMDNKIQALTKAFETLTKLLEKSFIEIAESLWALRRLPEIVAAMQTTMVTQLDRMFQQQMEAQVLTRYANLQVAQKRLESVTTLEQEKLGQLKADTLRVTSRYAKLLEHVSGECESRIRQLDSHGFDIMDRIYPKDIQERFSFESAPALRVIGEHAGESAVARTVQLDAALEGTARAIHAFQEARRRFKAGLEPFFDPRFRAGAHAMAVMVAEVRDETTGVIQTHYLVETADGEVKPLHDSLHGWVEPYLHREQAARARVAMEAEEIAAIRKELDALGAGGLAFEPFETLTGARAGAATR